MFWHAIERIKIFSLVLAVLLFIVRITIFQFEAPLSLTVVESWSCLFAVFGFGSTYLNRPSVALTYLSKAVYPVYILHMIFLNLSATLILTNPISVKMVTYVIYIEADSPAQEAGLIVGDQVSNPEVLKITENSIAVLNVTRKTNTLDITLYPDGNGYTGAHFSPVPYFIPKFTPSGTIAFTAFVHFIFINLLTFSGCLFTYEFILRRLKWIKLLFGMKINQ